MLNQTQIAQYQNNGFLLGPKVLTDAQVETLRGELERVIRENSSTETIPNEPFLFRNLSDPKTPVWQIVNIWFKSKPFQELVFNKTIVEEIAQLSAAKQIRLWHDQIQYKPAGTGGVNMWHQDSPYWPNLTPAIQLTAWVALDDVDESNGCMSMVPTSHLWGEHIAYLHTLKSFDAMPGDFQGHEIKVVKCPVAKGQVHFHHSLTWHGSHANTSGRPRRAIALHYMPGETLHKAPPPAHVLDPFIKAPEGEPVEGEYFPLVWPPV